MVMTELNLKEFNLSQLKALYKPGIGQQSLVGNRHNVVVKVPSATPSPAFSELVITLGGNEISDPLPDVTLFETFRVMKEVRPFELVFSPNVISPAQEKGLQRLAGAPARADVEGFT